MAHNVGGIESKLGIWVMRNPATITFTVFAQERFPASLFMFEQDCLLYFSLAPYFLVAGVIVGFLMPMRNSSLGAVLTLSYGIWFSVRLFQMASRFDLHWSEFIPHLFWHLALTPVYLTAVLIGRAVRLRVWPRLRIRDLLMLTAVAAGFMTCISTRVYLTVPVAVFTLACFTTWLLWTTIPVPTELKSSSDPAGN